MKNINKTYLFLFLTFAISFSLAGVYKLTVGEYTINTSSLILGVIYMFIPMLCVLIVEKLIHKQEIKRKLLISFKLNKWFIIAWLITPILSIMTLFISLLIPEVTFSPGMDGLFQRFEEMLTPEQMEQMKSSMDTLPFHPFYLALLQGLIMGATINAIAGLGEELGWRGFLLNAYKDLNFLKASLYIGIIWGVWHSPLILMGHNYPQHPEIGALMMIVFCILFTPLFLYITIKSKSVIAAAVMHGTLNATAGLAIMVVSGGNDLLIGITGLAGFISLIIMLLSLFLYDRYISRERIMTNLISGHLNNDNMENKLP